MAGAGVADISKDIVTVGGRDRQRDRGAGGGSVD